MKKIWKKFVSVSFLFIFILSLGAGTVQAAEDEDIKVIDYDESELVSLLDEIFQVLTSEESTDYFLEMDDKELDQTLEGYSFDAEMLKYTINTFGDMLEECGGYRGKGDYHFEVDDKEITMTVDLKFVERNVKLTVIYDENAEAKSVTFSPEYTFAEKMQKAAINTLIGMGTVFAVLIVMCILFYGFKLFSKNQGNESQSESPVSAVAQTSPVSPNLVQDAELVAVIAAAVAASMGTTSTDGFVVRSIKKRRR